jgi:zinc/manganese transport system permease protein
MDELISSLVMPAAAIADFLAGGGLHDLVSSMLVPFVACVVLVGIHVYLGMHVLLRQVIFVDLALAQFAALGSIFGMVAGFADEENKIAQMALSFGFAALGAIFFAFIRPRSERIGQEAIIGICYAVALSAALLLSTKLAHGADELRELFSGNILWVEPSKIAWSAGLYAAVGIFHFIFRKQFFAISRDHAAAKAKGMLVGLWDFFFYFTFAMVVTSSVSIAGVLLVFAFLVIPASTSFLLADTLRYRLIVGWILGTLVSVAGVIGSYYSELPTGPLIVVVLAFVLVAVAILTPKRSVVRK